MYAVALQAVDDGLTLKGIALDIPHDPAALVVYAMLGLFVFFIWFASRASVVAYYSAEYDLAGPESDASVGEKRVFGERDGVRSGMSPHPHRRMQAGGTEEEGCRAHRVGRVI